MVLHSAPYKLALAGLGESVILILSVYGAFFCPQVGSMVRRSQTATVRTKGYEWRKTTMLRIKTWLKNTQRWPKLSLDFRCWTIKLSKKNFVFFDVIPKLRPVHIIKFKLLNAYRPCNDIN